MQAVRTFNDIPYLLYLNNDGAIYISCNTVLPSQYMRKWIASEIGCSSEWDWRKYEFMNNINSTIIAFDHQIV